MPETVVKLGFGSLLKRGDGAVSETFTTVAEVVELPMPNLKLDTPEATHHGSPGGWREFIAGLLDAGDVKIKVNWLPSNATQSASTGALADMPNRVKRNWQIVLADGASTTWSFAAYVAGFEGKANLDKPFEATITLKVTGQPTLA